ncbi:phage tail tape measure protein [Serratia marcescens]|uniref:phage tail tape measure protein n=1 Tax=Serratia marcescens TaxID=615 RepID=UPI00217B8F6D|nr:phage tail tape measure protein [Serratia marcescens]CAI1950932.1 phage tail tape measure protein, TP901 family, core region [Serratia marcescens]
MSQVLTFTTRLIDQVSRPAQRMQMQLGGMANRARSSFKDMGAGAAGLWGTSHLTKSLLEPAIAYSRAERAVKSLGATQSTLKALGDMAIKSSNEFGMGAEHIVQSAYAIQGGMGAALVEGALPRIANAADIMAKATRASNEVATTYIASTYGVFQKYADKMGQAKWAEQLAGQTALAVKIYRTSGQQMADAFAVMGSTGSANGQSQASQLAILGNLQSMGVTGSVAGTQYEQFLTSIKGSGKKLGMNFTNSDGGLQDITVILDKLHKRFGDLSKVKDQNMLKKALGSDVSLKFLLNMIDKVPKLKKEIGDLANVRGLGDAETMAKDQVIGWDRLSQSIKNVGLAIGQGLNPALEPLSNGLANVIGDVGSALHDFPNLARWIGYGAMSMSGMTAAASGLLILKGFGKLMGFGTLGKDIGLLRLLLRIFMRFSGLDLIIGGFTRFIAMLRWLRGALIATRMYLILFRESMVMARVVAIAAAIGQGIATAAMWAFGTASAFAAGAVQLLLSPITLIILGIVALAAGIYYLITHWDELKASLMQTAAFQTVMAWADKLGSVFVGVWASIKQGWNDLLASIGSGYNWMVEKLNHLPGVNLDTTDMGQAPPALGAALPGPDVNGIPRGGIGKQVSNSKTNTQIDQSKNINTVNVNVQNMPSPAALQEYQEMQAG